MLAAAASQLALLWREFSQVPSYHLYLEGFLLMWVTWLLARRFTRHHSVREVRLTKEEEDELLAEWKPEPLVPKVDPQHPALNMPIMDGKLGKYVNLNGKPCLDMATHNYLGLAGNEEIEKAAVETIRRFGVGSCGPRGFYGTADVHIHLEERLAEFLGTQQSVLYSYGFSTIASAIPAYAKKGDIIFADEMVNFAIQKALDASRSKIRYFKHNNCAHLREILELQAVEDRKHPKSAKVSRRFLVVEGIYLKSGLVCNIEEMIEVKHEYKLRFFIDESVSFGVLGAHGKGITEHKNIPVNDIDLIMASLENSIGSVGGFVAGSGYVVEHQILAGLGYAFSASLPPMLATATHTAIDMMSNNPEMFLTLRENCRLVHDAFGNIEGLDLFGDWISPVKHLRMSPQISQKLVGGDRQKEKHIISAIVKEMHKEGVAVVMAAYLEEDEVHLPPISIRLTCNIQLTSEDIQLASETLDIACKNAFYLAFR